MHTYIDISYAAGRHRNKEKNVRLLGRKRFIELLNENLSSNVLQK